MNNNNRSSLARARLAAGLTFATGAMISAGLAWQYQHGIDTRQQTAARMLAVRIADELQTRAARANDVLYSLRLLMPADGRINRIEFHRLVHQLGLRNRLPEVDSVGYAQLAHTDELPQLEASMRQDASLNGIGYPEVKLVATAGRRDYLILTYLVPPRNHDRRLGTDLLAPGSGLRAADLSNGPLTLPQGQGLDKLSAQQVSIGLPLTYGAASGARSTQVEGLLLMNLDLSERYDQLADMAHGVDLGIRILGPTTDNSLTPIFHSPELPGLRGGAPLGVASFALHGRPWRVECVTLASGPDTASWLILLAGLVISAATAWLQGRQRRRYLTTQQTAAQLRAQLQQQRLRGHWQQTALDRSTDAVLLVDRDGQVEACNQTAAALLGQSGESIAGQALSELGLLRQGDLAELQHRISSGQAADFQVEQSINGEARWLDIRTQALDEIPRRHEIQLVRDISKARIEQRTMRDLGQMVRDLTELSSDWHWEADVEYRITQLSRGAFDLLGLEPEQVLGHRRWELPGYEADPQAEAANRHAVRQRLAFRDFVYRFNMPRGEVRYISTSGTPSYDEQGQFQGYRGTGRDITATKLAEAALFEEKERAQVTLESLGEGVITTDTDGNIRYLNPIAIQLTGWSAAEAIGKPSSFVFKVVDESSHEQLPDPILAALKAGHPVSYGTRTEMIRLDGEEFAIEGSASPIRGRNGQLIGGVLVFRDVSQSRELAAKLTYQATHDALTGLLNRREFEHRLKHLLTQHHVGDLHALLYIDLDQFKIVNDTCGHIAGDELLKQLAGLMHAQLRTTDTFARMGGDEFAVLLERCNTTVASRIAEQLRAVVADFHFAWEDKLFSVGTSIGLVSFSGSQLDHAALMSAADTACYLAKEKGRNRVHVHHAEDIEVAQRHGEMEWVGRLHKALNEDRFQLYFQRIEPISTAEDGAHFEVLVRMIDESGNSVPPGSFIPAAERYNLMPAIDRWIVRHVFDFLAENRTRLPKIAVCAINLSGASIGDDGFLAILKPMFDEYRIPHGMICFEVTETAAIANLNRASQFVRELKSLGCRFALDDFGSGMSSFGYLKHLPVDYLKIDGGFVKDMLQDPIDTAMVEAINSIGHVMGLKTIAEFVENDGILARLQSIGVDFAQGYGIAKPLPIDTLIEY
ncbi:EAL domain-containing protein [Chitinivorax sp. PXF-14]|uniref:EAL domain-containing protein n=1 Tax=Chitinivorax sp. PXF-14 TaxID=3230488 RepID=UPI003467A402